ncbi:PIG-L family deacetylase [Duganella sp. HH105]|uniref:PIG-L family deacetylase n=1 Tax=Duganella sp. HH105 TaxID=1781067 RepID=UPI000893A0BA|nr:PIG-L family deacetylase [Duganella sp. HH105]OEZ64138.1 GlcNAc-PI de-N-acetylase [Duganella sp. HH105]
MKFISRVAATALLAVTSTVANSAVFLVAHPDDLTFLMGGNVITDISGNYPTVVVILSAGDAMNLNQANNPAKPAYMHDANISGNPYYRVRLQAHEAAIKTWMPASYSRIPQVSTEYFSPSAPAVEKVVLGNVVNYYLNLPDTKIAPLYDQGGTMKDVEGINSYTQASLKETIRQIISRNNKNTPTLAVNYQEPDPDHIEPWYNEAMLIGDKWYIPTYLNVDHGDHTAAGKFVRDAIKENSRYWCVGQIIYMGYATTLYPEVPGLRPAHEAGALAMNQVLVDKGNWTWNPTLNNNAGGLQPGAWDNFHKNFIGKQKFRLYGIPNAGACAF